MSFTIFRKRQWKVFAMLLLSVGCSDFGDTNDNPNASRVPVPFALLTEAITGVPSTEAGRSLRGGIAGIQTVGAPEPMLYVQYWSESQYPEDSQYSTTFALWDNYYAVSLQDLQSIIDFNTNEETKLQMSQFASNNNQLAVARILKAYLFWVVTDRWGDVPYTDALKKNTQPAYTPQQQIYSDLFKELREAGDQFDNGSMLGGDILFHEDAAKWKKFTNSLRMLMALRISNVDPGTAKTEFLSALNDDDGHIIDNSDNAFVAFLDDDKLRNPLHVLFDGRDDYGASDVLVNTLKDLNDPRVTVFVDPTESDEYIGLPYGLQRDMLIDWTNENEYSRPGSAIRETTSRGYILTASQILFAKAEAALLNWTTDDAADLYYAAIQASWNQQGVFDQDAFEEYTTQDAVEFTGTEEEKLSKIGTQRWIALYPNGTEAWFEWRRTGYPNLQPTPYAVNASKQIPRRYAYPNVEATLNKLNYQEASGRITGGDTHDSHVWWDVQ
ncbi:SusD/RagB family nutrient-binding outer membrane lipoprotein [Ohtaekwangia koreensis]|uniref:Susd and RagB outer membrane lipoprotein n=1 Tax=Ohtaekwangia koreensis TaxID=688867 RepID=A0A1T5K2Y3_9BACT|nr:SusD/RagB family nutrient-binding outer membrane lipoprotein [Ohtaekwangia koreensis]SKC58056.1 Susd and RagB outer membrane lipoprotein [Ohtaekwangia koreensis]